MPENKILVIRGGAIGDPAHFLEIFRIETPQEHRIDDRACQLPPFAWRLGALHGRKAVDVPGDFRGQQPAVLHAALVRFALDVQDDPAGLRIAVALAVTLHGRGVGTKIPVRGLGLEG